MAFNSREYEWADITLYVGGRVVTGARSVKYTIKQEKELAYAKGNDPHSIQRGNKSYEAEFGFFQSELEALTAGGRDLVDLELTAVISYGNPTKGDMIVTDRLEGIQFTDETREMKQGDKFMEVTVPALFLARKKIV